MNENNENKLLGKKRKGKDRERRRKENQTQRSCPYPSWAQQRRIEFQIVQALFSCIMCFILFGFCLVHKGCLTCLTPNRLCWGISSMWPAEWERTNAQKALRFSLERGCSKLLIEPFPLFLFKILRHQFHKDCTDPNVVSLQATGLWSMMANTAHRHKRLLIYGLLIVNQGKHCTPHWL